MAIIEMYKKYGRCIKPYKTITTDEFNRFPPVICKDGAFISAQAGINYSSYPRENLDDFEYIAVEVLGNEVTAEEESLAEFECRYDNYIYEYVPVEVLDKIIEAHGGLDTLAIDKYIEEVS